MGATQVRGRSKHARQAGRYSSPKEPPLQRYRAACGGRSTWKTQLDESVGAFGRVSGAKRRRGRLVPARKSDKARRPPGCASGPVAEFTRRVSVSEWRGVMCTEDSGHWQAINRGFQVQYSTGTGSRLRQRYQVATERQGRQPSPRATRSARPGRRPCL